MRVTNRSLTLLSASLLSIVPVASQAGTIFVPRNTVVPVVVESDMSINRVRVGDRFTAHVDNDRDLPLHTRLIGRVRKIHQDRDEQRGFVDLEFTDVILPDGSRHAIDATPVSLDKRFTERGSDGRIVVKEDAHKKESLVLGGVVGGFILGSIIHKQAETTLLGTLAGVIAAEADRKNDGYTVLYKGQKVGMLVDHDVKLESYYDRRDNRWTGPRLDDRRDDDRDRHDDDRYRRDDDRRDGPPPIGRVLSDTNARPVVMYEGKEIRFDEKEQPYRDGGVVMVSLDDLVRVLKLRMERGHTNGIYVDGEDYSLRLEPGDDDARLNGRSITLSRPVVEKDGVTYVPVDIFASLKHGNLLVDGNRIAPKSY